MKYTAQLMLAQLASYGLCTPEFEFYEVRKWRFDYAWVAQKVALEIEGGTRKQGRHNRHEGYEGDCRKYNRAQLLGWLVIRATTEMVQSGEATILLREALLLRS